MAGRKCEVCDIAISTKTLFHQSNASTWAPQSLPVVHVCQTCLNDFTLILQKAKSLRSWTALENIDKELVEKAHGLEMQLQFLRLWNSSPMKGNPEGEVMTIATDDGQIFQAHRSMLVSVSIPIALQFTSVLLYDSFICEHDYYIFVRLLWIPRKEVGRDGNLSLPCIIKVLLEFVCASHIVFLSVDRLVWSSDLGILWLDNVPK